METGKTVSTCLGCGGGCAAFGTSGNGIALRPEGNALGDEALRDFSPGGGLGIVSALRLRINCRKTTASCGSDGKGKTVKALGHKNAEAT